MTKDEITEQLENYVKVHQLGKNSDRDRAIVSALNLLADLKGYKIQYCRKAARPNAGPR